jgi:glycosyltransferase involved in cell wall biosynthesis
VRVGLVAYLAHAGSDYRAAGVSMYATRLLQHLPTVAPENTYTAFVGRDAPEIQGMHLSVSPVNTVRPPIRIGWEQTGLPLQAARAGLDLLHCMVNVSPLLYGVPVIVTVHDLSFLRFPETFPRAKAIYLRLATGYSARSARRVIAVSDSTRRDLIELAGVQPERISVVHLGVDDRFRRLPDDERAAFAATVFGGRPFILYVGTLQPRKRVDLLIRAYARLRTREAVPHALALIGARGWMFDELFQLVHDLGLENDVRFVDYVTPEQLPLWYNAADVFVYPSVYEGFGLPVLEAMACGTPVVTSASSSLIEVVGDAGVTVEPESDEALAQGVGKVLEDRALHAELQQRGLRRAAARSWETVARDTARVYDLAMSAR